ncbi:MAG: PilZ domain-containing protein [Candidatus Solibacter sp.]
MTDQRRHLRYSVETTHLAHARFQGVPKPQQRPVLIANLSYSGCSLIAIAQPDEVAEGDTVVVQFGQDDFCEVEIVRIEPLTSRSLRLACRFMD